MSRQVCLDEFLSAPRCETEDELMPAGMPQVLYDVFELQLKGGYEHDIRIFF